MKIYDRLPKHIQIEADEYKACKREYDQYDAFQGGKVRSIWTEKRKYMQKAHQRLTDCFIAIIREDIGKFFEMDVDISLLFQELDNDLIETRDDLPNWF